MQDRKGGKEYYSTSECGEICNVSRVTVFNWIRAKKINAQKIAGNYLIPAAEVEKIHITRDLWDEDKKVLRSFVTLLLQEYGDFLKVVD